ALVSGLLHRGRPGEGGGVHLGDQRGVRDGGGLAAVAWRARGDKVAGVVAATEGGGHDVVDRQLHIWRGGAAVSAGVVVAAQDFVADALTYGHRASPRTRGAEKWASGRESSEDTGILMRPPFGLNR